MSNCQFVYYIQDLLAPFCRTALRKVFGCTAFYVNGVMFGFVDSDKLFLKADKDAAVYFKSHGSAPFTYQREGKKVALSYWEVPIDVLEDNMALKVWVDTALRAAQLAAAKKRKRKKLDC